MSCGVSVIGERSPKAVPTAVTMTEREPSQFHPFASTLGRKADLLQELHPFPPPGNGTLNSPSNLWRIISNEYISSSRQLASAVVYAYSGASGNENRQQNNGRSS